MTARKRVNTTARRMSMAERSRLYDCIHEAVTRARVRFRTEDCVFVNDKADRIIADITEAAFRPFVDGPAPVPPKKRAKGKG